MMTQDKGEQFLDHIARQTVNPSWPHSREFWRHYRGGVYVVETVAVNEANHEPLVIYRSQDARGLVWARPVSSWLETVEVDGEQVPRFTRIGG